MMRLHHLPPSLTCQHFPPNMPFNVFAFSHCVNSYISSYCQLTYFFCVWNPHVSSLVFSYRFFQLSIFSVACLYTESDAFRRSVKIKNLRFCEASSSSLFGYHHSLCSAINYDMVFLIVPILQKITGFCSMQTTAKILMWNAKFGSKVNKIELHYLTSIKFYDVVYSLFINLEKFLEYNRTKRRRFQDGFYFKDIHICTPWILDFMEAWSTRICCVQCKYTNIPVYGLTQWDIIYESTDFYSLATLLLAARILQLLCHSLLAVNAVVSEEANSNFYGVNFHFTDI